MPPPFPLPDLASLRAAAELIHPHIAPTPAIRWPMLCGSLGAEVWVKHENHTRVGAFKIRGGLVYFNQLLSSGPRPPGVIAATRGNHGQSVAFCARLHNLPAVIVAPHGNSPEKNATMQALGAELIESGHDFQAAFEHATTLAQERNLHFVPSFAEPLVRGVATLYLELFESVPGLDAVYVPIGLGSGICGALAARAALNLKTEIVGVVAASAPAYARSFAERRAISADVAPTIADGMACRVPNAAALDYIFSGVSRMVTVGDPEIRAAMRLMFTATHNAAEGAGAAALAALFQERERMRGRRVAIVLTGANVDADVFAGVLSERA
jgi:threonine dehydratase